MWIISFRDDQTYESLYTPDYIIAVGKTKEECEKDFENRASHMYNFNPNESIYEYNANAPQDKQLLIYEV